jgi:DNA-damage-inducible protein D
MSEKLLPVLGGKAFEDLKLTNTHGAEYWSARDLQPLLGYSQWHRFQQAIERAMTSCETSGNSPANHFAGAGKMVELSSQGQREANECCQVSRIRNHG